MEEETICLLTVVVIFGFVGFVLNFFLMLSIILTDGFAESPANLFVLSLACADALMACLSVPLYIYNMYYSAFSTSLAVSSFFALAITGSVFLLTVNRYISIVRSLKYPTIITFTRAVTMVVVIWLVAFVVLVLAVVSLISEETPDLKITRYIVAFYIVSSIVFFVYMYNLGRKHAKRLAQQAFAVTGQLQVGLHEFKKLRSLFMIAGSFGVCWLPVTIQAIILDREKDPVQFYRAFCLTASLPVLNTIIDPEVYYFRSKGFRVSLRKFNWKITNSGYYECCFC